MPKSRKRKRPTTKENPPPNPSPFQPWLIRRWKALAAFFGPSAVFVGVASGVLAFLPHVVVEPVTPTEFDSSSPSALSFVIANTGPIPLTDVQPTLGVCRILGGQQPQEISDRCPETLPELHFQQWLARKLRVDERYTIRLDDVIAVPKTSRPWHFLSAADLSIVVHFYPWFLAFRPFNLEREFRFKTKLEADGKLSWEARPVEK